MNRQEKLEWLARKLTEWGEGVTDAVTVVAEAAVWCGDKSLPAGFDWFTRKEWLDMREKLQNRPQDNSWFERGELPPVGTHCEFNHPEFNRFVGCLVVGHFRHEAVCAPSGGNYFGGSASKFRPLIQLRPLRTEREKAIDAAMDGINVEDGFIYSSRSIIEKLYDAGMLK